MASAPSSRLYFVRHGRSTHNESDEERPIIWDAPLHKIGIRQAALLRQRLRDIPIEVCVSSPLTRALQTSLIALGEWSQLASNRPALVLSEQTTTRSIQPTVQVDDLKIRFDASEQELELVESGLGPGAKVRLHRRVHLEGGRVLEAGTACTVTNASVLVSGAAEARSCLDVFPAAPHARCPVVAVPDASEKLHESDDIGSAAPELRRRFPMVDLSQLPMDNRAWWWCDPQLPDSTDASACRGCWEAEGYDEPDDVFEARIARLVQALGGLAAKHRHVAVFSHFFVMEEIWRQRFGIMRRFSNAELAVVEVSPLGEWRWADADADSTSESSSIEWPGCS